MEGNDWDLSAVVRGCGGGAKFNEAASEQFGYAAAAEEKSKEEMVPVFPQETRRNFEGLEEPIPTVPKVPCYKRKKKQQIKKVICQVPADGVSPCDVWAWRKYGQKPIRGSPYPRGYYRCSSVRGCPARKQVERNRGDPSQLIITYTGEHNHKSPSTAPATTASASSSAAVAANKTEIHDHHLTSSPATSASMNDDNDEEKQEGEEVLKVEDIEVIGEDELVFISDDTSIDASKTGGFDDRLFDSPWIENTNNVQHLLVDR